MQLSMSRPGCVCVCAVSACQSISSFTLHNKHEMQQAQKRRARRRRRRLTVSFVRVTAHVVAVAAHQLRRTVRHPPNRRGHRKLRLLDDYGRSSVGTAIADVTGTAGVA